MKSLIAMMFVLLATQASAQSASETRYLDLSSRPITLNRALVQANSGPPRGLCAKADYYCSRGYQNWCEVWELNHCDEL